MANIAGVLLGLSPLFDSMYVHEYTAEKNNFQIQYDPETFLDDDIELELIASGKCLLVFSGVDTTEIGEPNVDFEESVPHLYIPYDGAVIPRGSRVTVKRKYGLADDQYYEHVGTVGVPSRTQFGQRYVFTLDSYEYSEDIG